MGFFIHFHLGLGGITHEKFVKRLLKKFKKEDRLHDFIKISLKSELQELDKKIKDLINN